MLKIGIAGRRGAAFYAGLRALPDVQLAALCDLDESWLKQEADAHAVPFTTPRFAEMLDHVDAVVVATPMQLHAAHSVMALQAGKHVMSEVTAAVSLDECWRIADAVRTSGKTYMMAENYCYIRDNVLIGELVRKGFFGEVYFGEGEYLHDVKPYHHTADGGRTWRYYWQVGTPGSTYPTHSVGPLMQWFQALDPDERIESVVCLGTGRHTDPENPHDDTAITLCRLRSGKLIRIRVDMLSNRPHHMTYYTLQGTCGVYEASRTWGPGQVWFGKNPPPGPGVEEHRSWQPLADYEEHLPDEWKNLPAEAREAGHGGGDYFVVRDFVAAVRGEIAPPVDVVRAMEWTAVGLCSTLSLENRGVPIRVPNFADPAARPVLLDAPEVRV